jgi:thioesterase domain-containing protein
VGVAVGITLTEFSTILAASAAGRSPYASTGAVLSVASGRLSYALGLHGPCAAFETACSSALVASHTASRALRDNECDTHVAAGVNLMLLPSTSFGLALAEMTSPLGRSHTFDRRADGFVRGEAIGAVVLCSIVAADITFKGSAVRQDGRSASLTAPNGQAQGTLLEVAHADGGVRPVDLALAETHGTGTALGDPIEVGSLCASVVRHRVQASEPLSVGGLKANTGHSESAAGMIGLLKLALGLRDTDAAPNPQLRTLNPQLRGMLRPVSCLLPVQLGGLSPQASNGGVSSFGYSGTIAHVALAVSNDSEKVRGQPPRVLKRLTFAWEPPSAGSVPASTHLHASRTVSEIITSLAGGVVDVDLPLIESGFDSVSATALREELQEVLGSIQLPAVASVVDLTPREISLLPRTGDAGAAVVPGSALEEDVWLMVAETEQSGCLRKLWTASDLLNIFCVPAVTGGAFTWRYVRFALPSTTVYAFQDPLLASGQSDDLAISMSALAATWAAAALTTMDGNRHTFDIMGMSFGGLVASLVARAAKKLDARVRRLVSIDPIPPAPWTNAAFLNDMHGSGSSAAAYYLRICGDPKWEKAFGAVGPNDELAIACAQSLCAAGVRPFNSYEIIQTKREMRVMANNYRLTAHHVRCECNDYFDGPAMLVLASERVAFFGAVYSNTADESSAEACHKLGQVEKEIFLEGDHIDVCAGCAMMREEDFTSTLAAFLA